MDVKQAIKGINVEKLFHAIRSSKETLGTLRDTLASIWADKESGAYEDNPHMYVSELSALRTLYVDLKEDLIDVRSNLVLLKMARNDASRSAKRNEVEWELKKGKLEGDVDSWAEAAKFSHIHENYRTFLDEQAYFYAALAKIEGVVDVISERINDIAMKVKNEDRFFQYQQKNN